MSEKMVKRKQRSDKKIPIAPYIPEVYKVWIHRISNSLNISEGEVGALLVTNAIQDEGCLRFFSSFYKRDYTVGNITFMGHLDANRIDNYFDVADFRVRFKLRVSKEINNQLREFQIALDTSYLSHATLALLKYVLHNDSLMKRIAPGLDKHAMLLNAQPLEGQAIYSSAPDVSLKDMVPKRDTSNTNIFEPKMAVIHTHNNSHSVWSVLHRKGGE